MTNFSQPYNPVGGRDETVPAKRGFFSSLFSNKHSDAMNAYIHEQEKMGKRPGDVDWGAVTEMDLKAAYKRKYNTEFPK